MSGRRVYDTAAYKRLPRPTMECPRCGLIAKMTIEHIVPVRDGGTNDPTNLTYLCARCNSGHGLGGDPRP